VRGAGVLAAAEVAAMNIGEANATCKVLGWLRRLTITSDPDVGHDELAALEFLAARAGKALNVTAPAVDAVALVRRLRAADSDDAAQAVCQALLDHLRHGGSIPWPSISGPLDDWHVTVTSRRIDEERKA
jgi:hypothetical protein